MFDLIIFPLTIEAGRESYEVPGLFVASPPRKTARMRAQDILLLYWQPTFAGNAAAALTSAQQQEVLSRLAETYYTTSGSVTAGLHAVVTRLNEFLLNRNLRSGQGGQVSAALNLAVLRRETMVVAHAGSTHTFVLKKTGGLHFDDGQGMRSLGLSRQAVPRFHQATLEPGDFLIFCARPSESLRRSLAASSQGSLEHLRRRMLGESGVDLQAVAIRLQPGKGQVTYWKPTGSTTPPVVAAAAPAAAAPLAAPPDAPPEPSISAPLEAAQVVEEIPADEEPALDFSAPTVEVTSAPQTGPEHAEPVYLGGTAEAVVGPARPRPAVAHPETLLDQTTAEPVPEVRRPARRVDEHARSAQKTSSTPARPAPEPVPPGPPAGESLRRGLASVWRAGRTARAKVGGAVSSVTTRVMPRQIEPVSPGWMLAMALLVPLIVVTVASAVYFQTGRSEQFQVMFLQAQQAAQQAAQLADPIQQKEAWTRAAELNAAAERYGITEESTALRRQAQSALDGLQGLVRLEYRPAISSELGPNVVITRIIAKLNQVYLLDSNAGRIMSMARITTGGYEVNAFFTCGPGQAGGAIIGPLVDLAEIPVNNALNAEIMGIDAGGNLVYCASGKTSYDSRPLTLPDAGWGQIAGITTYGEMLYVLDTKANMVYWYGGDKGIFANPPHPYFDLSIPTLGDVVDIAVDQEFLYLLHANGQMTVCTAAGVTYANARCDDPLPYGDERPGFEPSPLSFAGARFTHIQTTQPPDPSLFALDANNQSIYHLSLRRLNLQRQYLAQTEANFPFPVRAPSAFAITPNRRVLVAFDNQIYFASLP